MIETVDDVIDVLDHTGSLIVGIRLGELPAQLVENARGLVTMSQVCARAPRLIKKPKKLEAVLCEGNAIENVLDVGYRSVLIEALVVGSDPLDRAIDLQAVVSSPRDSRRSPMRMGGPLDRLPAVQGGVQLVDGGLDGGVRARTARG